MLSIILNLITHKPSPKEENQRKLKPKLFYAQSPTPFCAYLRINAHLLQWLSLLLASHYSLPPTLVDTGIKHQVSVLLDVDG